MESSSPRVAGRPSVPILSRQRIVDAAFEILELEGAEGFSLSRLARSLGVRAPALYNHVNGRAHLINLMRRDMVHSMDYALLDGLAWQQALLHFGRMFRQALLRHPAAVNLIVATPISRDSEAALTYEELGRILRRAGVAPPRILLVIVAIESLVVGAALDVVAPGAHVDAMPSAGVVDAERRHAQVLCLGEQYARQAGSSVSDQSFDFGLRALIAAIEAEVSAERQMLRRNN